MQASQLEQKVRGLEEKEAALCFDLGEADEELERVVKQRDEVTAVLQKVKEENESLAKEKLVLETRLVAEGKKSLEEYGKLQTEKKVVDERLKKCLQVCQLLVEGVKKGQSGGVYSLEEAATLYTNIKELNEVLGAVGGGGAK